MEEEFDAVCLVKRVKGKDQEAAEAPYPLEDELEEDDFDNVRPIEDDTIIFDATFKWDGKVWRLER
jgi:hypothetical protein